ncbi:MAG TPA: Yip1 family protein [Gemmatimonadales bacterium]
MASTAHKQRRRSPLVARVAAILFKPGDTWNVIAGEFTTAGSIYKSHVLPLAAVPAISLAVGSILWGRPTLFGKITIPITTAVQTGVATYVLWLVSIFVIALVVNALASTFDGTANRVQAVKVAAYASTPALLAGAFTLLPTGGWLRLTSLYGLYLLYVGLTPVMKSPKDRSAGYAVVASITAIIVYLMIDLVTQAFLPRG